MSTRNAKGRLRTVNEVPNSTLIVLFQARLQETSEKSDAKRGGSNLVCFNVPAPGSRGVVIFH